MRLHTHIEIEPFKPHPLLRNPHSQTVAGSQVRKLSGITFRRERIDLPDGDFVDIDFADVENATWEQLGAHKPIVMMIHGLEGNARSGPAQEIYRTLSRQGVRCVGMNLRSCSGELNRTGTLYHAGATADIAYVHELLLERYPDVPIGLVGISLGANMLLKYIGENGATMREKAVAAVAISPPFDMMKGAVVMDSRLGRLYTQTMLRPLKEKVRGLAPLLEDKVDLSLLDSANTFSEFDDLFTAPLHGFDGADDYYTRSSSQNFLPDIQIPTLLLRAVDDPFFDPTDIPHDIVQRNPYLYGGFPQHGGHVGFIEGLPGNYRYWAERQAARFLARVV
ncbi:MAG: alpha/beta fold hydrolase [Chloroflexota bacterium]